MAGAAAAFAPAFADAIHAPLTGALPPLADTGLARAGLERLLAECAPFIAAAAPATVGAG